MDPLTVAVPDLDAKPSDIVVSGHNIFGQKHFQASDDSSIHISPSIIRARWQPVQTYHLPISQSATLPGPVYYMKLRKPGPELPMAVQLCLPNQKKFTTDTLIQVYGKHESLYNNLLSRYQ
ncbi:unnamed protein product, partial [Leptidea sinapis]